MVHYKKTFSTYLFFASSLVGLRRELANVKSFGTDGEQALIDAFQHEFSSSSHLTCCIHVRRNTKAKLQELGIAGHQRNVILNDLFGQKEGSHYSEGLVDTSNEKMYEAVFTKLVENWKKLDILSSVLAKFVDWFVAYKSRVLKSSMLKSVREKCGLGSPPVSFTTNASESINAMLKRKVDYKRNELPQFLHHLKACIDEQEQEIQKAVINRGKYALQPKYKRFKKAEEEWFLNMSETDRARHLQRFASFKMVSTSSFAAGSGAESSAAAHQVSSSFLETECGAVVDLDCSSTPQPDGSVFPPSPKRVKRQLFAAQELSVNVVEFSNQVNIPAPVLDGIWKKAAKLLTATSAITKAPGTDEKAHSVLSSSGNPPHLVTMRKNGQYVCDKTCGNWNSLRICAHTVVVAEVNNDLSLFVSWLVKSKKKPSLTKLLVTGMPDGRGKKGNKSNYQKKKVSPTLSRTPISSMLSRSSDTGGHGVSVPSCPPLLVHVSPQSVSPPSVEPFELCFISGNISVCYGCRQKYPKPCVAPNDLCVKHREWREFFPPGSATPQSRFGNCYYHCNVPCIQAKCPFFKTSMLKISAQVAVQLMPVHTEYLATYMSHDC